MNEQLANTIRDIIENHTPVEHREEILCEQMMKDKKEGFDYLINKKGSMNGYVEAECATREQINEDIDYRLMRFMSGKPCMDPIEIPDVPTESVLNEIPDVPYNPELQLDLPTHKANSDTWNILRIKLMLCFICGLIIGKLLKNTGLCVLVICILMIFSAFPYNMIKQVTMNLKNRYFTGSRKIDTSEKKFEIPPCKSTAESPIKQDKSGECSAHFEHPANTEKISHDQPKQSIWRKIIDDRVLNSKSKSFYETDIFDERIYPL